MHRKLFPLILILGLLLGTATPSRISYADTAPWPPYFAAPTTVATFGTTDRPWGIAAGDFDGDGHVDLVIGRATGHIFFAKGNGDGTFAAPTQYAWKQTYFNAWSFAAGDVNGDSKPDVIWGANANSPSTAPYSVNDGEVRVFLGNGDGTFVVNSYYVSGVLHNAGTLLADIGADAGSLAAGDVDGDGDVDVIAGGSDGAVGGYVYIRLLRNAGGGVFTVENIYNQSYTTALTSPIYYPAVSTQNSPWGLALGDVDADGDLDLWVGDRALYVYLYLNDGAGDYALQPPASPPLPTRPNVLLAHDTYRAAVGYTPALGSADVNGDGRADLVLGLQSGAQTTAIAHDGEILLRPSTATNYAYGDATVLADIGMVTRGINVLDVNGDTYRDIVAGQYGGTVHFLRQVRSLDTDNDGIADRLDNAPYHPNAPRLDMNTDGAKSAADQLDNDFDTVLGDPANPATWQRLGDPADPDDDNDGVLDGAIPGGAVPDGGDNCPFVANADQANADGDTYGDACDPLENQDTDGDGVVDGPLPGDALYDAARAAAIKWSQGATHFVIRIDSLGRWWQNEFAQILTDAAILSPADWAVKCWENYQPEDGTYEPCGVDGSGITTLPGGKQVPISLAVVPKQLWTDPPVVTWINDRNNTIELEIAQHGAYHANNTPNGDWAADPNLNRIPCETCGLTEAENFEFLRVGYNTLIGNYDDKWVAESGATSGSPRIDWTTSANPLISYSPPYNASDTMARRATAQFGYRSFSASVCEENPACLGWAFSPEGSHMEQFDQFGMFHVSVDLQLLPPETPGDIYDEAAYLDYLESKTQAGGLTAWLIEEVDWSGRPCNTLDRLGTCNGGSNRENNTVYLPRWQAWMTLLDYVKAYPDGVVMTLGEVALAKAFDNAPTVPNAGQADADQDGVGDVIDGATLVAADVAIRPHETGALSATLTDGTGSAIAGQTVRFHFDADGDGTDETYVGASGADGVALASVTPTGLLGAVAYSADWDGLRATAHATGIVQILDVAGLTATVTPAAPGTVVLNWTYTGADADHYEVWRANNAPYFTPGDVCDVDPGCESVHNTTYTDTDGCSVPGTNCTYVVQVVTTDDWRSPGARLGVFNFGLTPGE